MPIVSAHFRSLLITRNARPDQPAACTFNDSHIHISDKIPHLNASCTDSNSPQSTLTWEIKQQREATVNIEPVGRLPQANWGVVKYQVAKVISQKIELSCLSCAPWAIWSDRQLRGTSTRVCVYLALPGCRPRIYHIIF